MKDPNKTKTSTSSEDFDVLIYNNMTDKELDAYIDALSIAAAWEAGIDLMEDEFDD